MPALKPVESIPVDRVATAAAVDPALPDPIPAELRAVLELFATELRDVAFPGVDAAVLRQHADDVRTSARDVDRARTALDAALAVQAERSRALSAVVARALAYATIYVADQPALAARLAAVSGTATAAAPPSTPGPRPRGRPRKTPRPQLPLDSTADASAVPDGDAETGT
jgi:hypothetical protein